MDQPVVGRTEQRMAGAWPEAGAIDQRLRMLDPKADRERLGVEVNATRVQHLEGVAGAVAGRENDVLGGDRFGRRAGRDREAAQGAGFDLEIDDPAAEPDLAAEALDLGAHLLDHADQAEGADVRLGDEADLFRRAGADEFVEHLAREMARIADLAPELAVGERAGAAFAELHVRFGVEHAAAPQAPGVLGALAYRAAALENERLEAHLGQDEGGEDAARAEADDDRPRPSAGREVGRRLRDQAIAGVGGGPDVAVAGVPREHGVGAHDVAVDGVDEDDRRLLARVVAAPEDREVA